MPSEPHMQRNGSIPAVPGSPLLQSDQDEDELTLEFDKIGRSVSFNMPQLPQLPQLPSFNLFQNDDKSLADFLVDQQVRQVFNKRRDQISEFVNDLRSGFSIQNALHRLQALRDVVQSTIELPILEDEGEEVWQNEPHGVVPVKEKQYPIIDELIIPQEEHKVHEEQDTHAGTNNTRRNRNRSIAKYNYLTNLTAEEFLDENILRSRIKKILSLQNVPDAYRNTLVQNLMMKSYYEKIRKESSKETEIHLKSQQDDGGSSSDYVDISSDQQSLDGQDEAEESDDEVILTTLDLKPTYQSQLDNVLGCSHYKRNCKIECNICNKWFTCRFCHDQVVQSHQLPRAQTKHVLCMFCFTPQLPSQICINEECGQILSHYYCDKCKLFDNDLDKDIYHCDDCGICRLGQGLNQDFFHCNRCNACISIDLQVQHRCIENSTHSNCTICGDYMFNSIKTVVFMQCGHPIHQSCFDEYTKHSYKCPICSRTIINMEAQFRVLDQEISLQPLPEPYGLWKCIVQCNDCKLKSMVKYHILGLKCENCKSYNTSQIKILKNEQDLKEFETKSGQKEGQDRQQINFFPENENENEEEEEKKDNSGEDFEEYDSDDDLDAELQNYTDLINNDTLRSFEKYKEWFFSSMDNYLNQLEKLRKEDKSGEADSGSELDSYEEDDYDDMR